MTGSKPSIPSQKEDNYSAERSMPGPEPKLSASPVARDPAGLSQTIADHEERCNKLQAWARMLIRFISSVEGDEKSSDAAGALEKANSSLQALEEQLSGWSRLNNSSNVQLESYRVLTKCRAELDDIQFNMMLDITPAFRMELLRIRENIDEDTGRIEDSEKEVSNIVGGADVKVERSVRQTSFQVDIFGLLFWLRNVYLAFVDKFFFLTANASTSLPHIRGLPTSRKSSLNCDETLDNIIWNFARGAYTDATKQMTLHVAIGSRKHISFRKSFSQDEVAKILRRSQNCIYIRSAPSLDALLLALAASLPPRTTSSNSLEDIVAYLKLNPSSLFVTLDQSDELKGANDIVALRNGLGELSRSSDICLVLTTNDLALAEESGWRHFVVKPLSVEMAVVTFKAISGRLDDDDDELKRLVLALGCVAFSISIAGRLGFRPTKLIQQLESSHDAELGRFDDIVRTSLTSPTFASNPEALSLLGILARLPKGAQYDTLPQMAPLIQNLGNNLKILKSSGHINWDGDGFIFVHAPTCFYVSRYQVLDAPHVNALRGYYFKLCKDGGHELGTETFKNASKLLALEEDNTRAVLLDALQNEPSTATLRAVVGYANFLFHNAPNVDVTGKALEVIESHPSLDVDGTLLPHCWFSHARLLHRLDKYMEAENVFRKAEVIWKKMDEFAQLGQCYVYYGQINRLLGRRAQSLESYTKAREYFEKVDNRPGISDSFQGLALLCMNDGDIQEALRLLEHAKDVCREHEASTITVSFYIAWVLRFEDPSYSASLLHVAREAYVNYGARNRAALCTYQIGIAQYSLGRHDEAEKSLLLAYREFDELDNVAQMGYALDHLVELEARRGDFDQALRYNSEALAVFEQIENPVEVADCYISRGRVLVQMRRTGDARQAYKMARTVTVQRCNSNSKLMRLIDHEEEEIMVLVRKLGWKRLLPW